MIDFPPHDAIGAAGRAAAAAWFGPAPLELGPPPSPGFSGAPLTLVRPCGATAWHVLKAFGPGTTRTRAAWVHELVLHASARGVAEMPPPVATAGGETVVTDPHGVHWELVPFVEGAPAETPTASQAEAALASLARLHAAAATLPGWQPRPGPSPAVVRRIARARDLLERPWRERRLATGLASDAFIAELVGRRDRAIASFADAGGDRAVAGLAADRADDMLLQPVLRDVWHAHVLFAPGSSARVAGIVDPHAAGIDSPAADLARLLGSWRTGDGVPPDPAAAWPGALAAYAAVRPLVPVERGLVPWLHASGVILGLDNWFRWTLEERRRFPNHAAVLIRIDRLIDNLPAACAWLADRREARV